MKEVIVSYVKLIRVIRDLSFKKEDELIEIVHEKTQMLFDYGKKYKDDYLGKVNKNSALIASDRSFLVDGGIAVIKRLTDNCMKIVFVWFDEIYERRLSVELFWWFAECESESFFCINFRK